MAVNLFEVELANLEDDQLHKAGDGSESKRQDNHRRLAARRAVEDHMEQQRLREELGDTELEWL